MKHFRYWIMQRFLPRYAHELLLDELSREKEKLIKAQRTIQEQKCYIAGLEFALRQLRGCRTETGSHVETKNKKEHCETKL